MQEPYDPSPDILAFFGSRCESTYGGVSIASFAQSGQLKAIVNRIANDEACKGIADALTQVQLNTAPLLNTTRAELDRRHLGRQVNGLQLALASEREKPVPDATYIEALEYEFATKQVALIEMGNVPTLEATRTRLDALGSLNTYSNTIFAELSRSSACVNHHPGVIAEVGAQMLAISSNLAAGAVGAVMLVSGTVLDKVITYLRTYKIARVWKQTIKDSMLPAIECGLESMASVYCEARDMGALAAWNARLQESKSTLPPDLQGVDILGRDLAAFVQWVSRLKTGSPATGPANASEKQAAIQLEADLDKYGILMQGSIRQAEFKLSSDNSDKENLIKELIQTLASIVQRGIPYSNSGPSSGPGPFKRLFQDDPECGPIAYFVSEGIRDTCKRSDETESCMLCALRMNNQKLPDSVSAVSTTTDGLLEKGRRAVSVDTAPYKESNPRLLLSMARTRGPNGSRPIDFLRLSLKYLSLLLELPEYANPLSSERRLIIQGIEQARGALAVLDYPSDPKTKKKYLTPVPPSGKPDFEAKERHGPVDDVNELNHILVPSNDAFSLANTVAGVTHQHLDKKLERGEIDPDIATLIQMSSADSLASVLQNFLGLDNVVRQSIVARTQAESNLGNFAELFVKNIEETLDTFQRSVRGKSANPSVNRQEHFQKLCLELALIPSNPRLKGISKKVAQACKGAVVRSVHSNLSLSFDEVAPKAFEDRVCALYDFNRKSKKRELRGH